MGGGGQSLHRKARLPLCGPGHTPGNPAEGPGQPAPPPGGGQSQCPLPLPSRGTPFPWGPATRPSPDLGTHPKASPELRTAGRRGELQGHGGPRGGKQAWELGGDQDRPPRLQPQNWAPQAHRLDSHETFPPPGHVTGRASPTRRGHRHGSYRLPGGQTGAHTRREGSGQRDWRVSPPRQLQHQTQRRRSRAGETGRPETGRQWRERPHR